MHKSSLATQSWSTSSDGGSPDTSPMELAALGDHLDGCKSVHGGWIALHCAAARINHFLAQRFLTTLLIVGLLIAGFSLFS